MNMNYTAVATFESVDIIGKTTSAFNGVKAVTGTIDRKTITRRFITEAGGFEGKHTAAGKGADDTTTIVTVSKLPEAGLELFVEFVGEKRSLASFKVFKGYTALDGENAGVVDVFVDRADAEACASVGRILACAERMDDSLPECDGQWKLVDADGVRHFVRFYAGDLDSKGMIKSAE